MMYLLYRMEGPMIRVQMSEARQEFAELCDRARVGGERIMLRRYGKDVAAIVPADDVKLLQALEDKIDNAAADKAMREKGKSIPWEKVKRELGL